MLAHKFEIILEGARAVHAAGVARDARMDFLERRVKPFNRVPRLFRTLDEMVGQRGGIAFFTRASCENKYLHLLSPMVFMIFRRRLDGFGPKSGGTGGSGRGHRQIFDEFTAVHVHPFQLFGCFRVCGVIDRLAPFVGLLCSRHFQRDMLEP